MHVHGLIAGAVPALTMLAALGIASSARAAGDEGLRADILETARRRVLFGHQSVGMNVLAGVARLVSREGLVLRVEDVSSAPTVAPATIAHVFVTENGDPDRKLRSFARVLDSLANASPDIALLKFCYVDFRADTDVEALFHRYQAAIAEYRARHPATTFVHVTAPLTTVQGGVKALVKRWSGRVPFGLAENARREEFNGLLRKAYQGREPLFDLARVESTRPDGRRETVDWNGRAVPALADAYALDDGHLNEAGQDRAARELLAVLAAVPLQATRP